jgi:histidine ammonia-lyase
MSHPASVDSTPTSANQEDHVSMACHGARRLLTMTDNLFGIIGIEALAACQGVEFRAPLVTSLTLQRVIATVRAVVPTLEEDRYMANDLMAATQMIATGRLNDSMDSEVLPQLRI